MLGRLAAACGSRARLVAAGALLLAVLGGLVVQTRLGITTDSDALFSRRLPWVQRQAELRHAFPQDEDSLVAVVDGAIPEEADVTAAALAEALSRDTAHFSAVQNPEASPYFERNGLLFVAPEPLEKLLDQTVDAQPFLGQLAADPSLAGLVGALSLIAEGLQHGGVDLSPFLPAMQSFHQSLAAADARRPLSWETLLAGPMADLGGRFRFVLAVPKLQPGAMQPGAAATKALRDAAAKLEFVRSGSARVRITGAVALQEGEFAAVANGALGGLAGSLVLILLWLFLAVRSWRLMLPILLTLLLGLDLTTAFAALAVGTLNLVSIAYAVLFVGLAVDFAIQFTMRFREAGGARNGAAAALGHAARRGGAQILVAALATAAGFLAFTPTAFAGVAQLGLIAGVGMLIALACTLTALPALIALFRPAAERGEAGYGWARPVDSFIARRYSPVLGMAALLTIVGIGALPWLQFDSDPLHAQDQRSEAVQTLNDLGSDPLTSPYRIEFLLPSMADAQALAPKLSGLSAVAGVLDLNSLVPEDQTEKLALIADTASLLGTTLNVDPAPHPDAARLRQAIRDALPEISEAAGTLPRDHPYSAIAADLRALAAAPDARLVAADVALTRFLPMQLDRLRNVLKAGPVTAADIPVALARDWVTVDGRAKLQVLPNRAAAQDNAGLQRFVAEVTAVAPGAGGAAVSIVRSAGTIVSAFRTALLAALAAITIILLVALRRVLDTVLVLAPLLLAALLSVIAAVVLDQPLNIANLIALPLLLGIGVAFNIYFVMNWRAGRAAPLSSATARAVLFSALTTATAFGSLALSRHPGTASMGRLLLASLACTLVVTLVFVPAMLAACSRPR